MALSKTRYKASHAVSFGIMCFLTLFCIAAAVKHDVFRDGYVCIVSITDILCLIFLTLLTGILRFKREEAAAPMRYFTLVLQNIHIATFFSALTYSVYQLPGYARQIAICSTLDYFFTMMLFLTLWFYQKQFLEPSAVTRAVTVFIVLAIAFYTAVLIVNLFHPLLFLVTEEGTYSERMVDYISIITGGFCLILLSVATFASNLNLNRKLSFLSCIFLPVLFAMLSLNHVLLNRQIYACTVMTVTVLLPFCLLFFNAHDQLEHDVVRQEKEQAKLQIAAMISQMQPHFLYNSLAVIAALCEQDPKLAAEATNAFSSYLRENMDFADKTEPVSFSEELKHIETYVWLEKLRFQNKITVEYDIRWTAFPVPALSVQPMVENAIKHGVCRRKSGGTVKISAFETDGFYSVVITDDGVGFDVLKTLDDGKRHLGIQNSRYRIREMVGGSLDIVSAPGRGTTVTIRIPK